MSTEKTIYLTKNNVEYELLIEKDRYGNISINEVIALNGIGVSKTEQDIDPEDFEEKLKDHEWEEIREKAE